MTTTTKRRPTRPSRQPEGYKFDEIRIRASVAILSGHPPFQEFMGLIRTERENAMRYAASHTAVENERETLAALGSFRVLDDIVAAYEHHLQAAEDELREESERMVREQQAAQNG